MLAPTIVIPLFIVGESRKMSPVSPLEIQQSTVVNEITRTPLPGSSRRIYVSNEAGAVHVPMREVVLSPTLLRGTGDMGRAYHDATWPKEAASRS